MGFLNNRWSLVIFGLMLTALIAQWVMGRSGPKLVGSEGAVCMTHADCAKALRCFAVSKQDDPFATAGECAATCTEDLQCPSGFKCQATVKGDGQSWLPGTRKVTEAAESVCVRK